MTQLTYTDLEGIEEELKKIKSDTILFITDGRVWEHHSKNLNIKEIFKDKKVIVWKTPEGEMTKTFKEYQSCLEFFLEKGVHRHSHIVAFGGGALSDFAGFIASTILRGIKWTIIPSTLLSMVDAAIGGKVAINSNSGKNLIGAFYPPEKVLISDFFLSTLPEEELKSGKGEVLKYAFLDKDIHELILQKSGLFKIIEACANFKLKVTSNDLTESDQRKILNLGHTLGHAIERIYRLPHGEAVVWGMAIFFKIFEKEEFIKKLQELKMCLDWEEANPPWKHKTFPLDDIINYISKDKKITSLDSIDIILADDPGVPIIKNIKLEELYEKLGNFQHELKVFSL